MPDVTPLRYVYDSGNTVGLSELQSGETIAATSISNTPAGNIAATTVQAAINELDTEKAGLALANTFTQPQTVTVSSTSAALTVTQTGTGNAFVVEDVASDTTPFVIGPNGEVGVGIASIDNVGLRVGRPISGSINSQGVQINGTVQPNVTGTAKYFNSTITTAANGGTPYTIAGIYHYTTFQSTFHSDSTITNQYGFFVDSSLTSATSNYGFYGNIAAATGRWNFYAAGTANNAYAGNSRFGGTTSPTVAADVTGAVLATTSITSSGATSGIGYSTGAGGTVTQITSRTTGVTLDKVTGAITLVSAAGSTTAASFTVTNSSVAATDAIIVNQVSGTDLYEIHITAVAAGSFRITFKTTGGTTTEQPVFRFTVIKGVSA